MRPDTSPRRLQIRPALFSVLLAFVLLVAAAAPRAEGLDGLSEFITIGRDAPWNGTMAGEAYVLSNSEDAAALKYVTASYNRGDDGKRTIAVDVEIQKAGEGARAGLIYAFVADPKSYYLFVVEPGHKVALYRRDHNGFKSLMPTKGEAIGDGSNRLSIVEDGEQIKLLVNGKSVGSFGNPSVGHGNAGIAAAGIGTFAFRNYEQAAK